MSGGPLAGVEVVDLSRTPAGAWCSRLLAGFGARVLSVEPVSDSPLCSQAPFDGEGNSIPADYWLANKEVLSLDFDAETDLERLRSLAASADVVVSTFTPSQAAALGLDYAALAAPGIVMTHVTPWGYESPWAEMPGNDLAVAAMSGWASINGLAGEAPLKPNGWLCSYYGGVTAFAATLAALYERGQSGRGQEVDVAVLDAMLVGFAPAFLRAQYTGTGVQRPAQPDLLTGPVPVKDGHFALTISRAHFWRDAMNLLGLPDLAEDPRWEASWYRAAHKDEYVGRVQERMAKWTKAELFEELAVRRVVAGPVLTMEELFAAEHLGERGFWEGAETDSGKLFAGAPAKFSRTPWQPAKPARKINTAEPRTTAAPALSSAAPEGKPPLAGLRGIVLTQAWAGTLCTEMLAMLGADVVQVEVRKRLDSWRGAVDAPLPDRVRGRREEQHPWNCNFLYNSVNLNKRCITLDLQTEEGKRVFLDLLPHADFVAENFSPRVMGNLGLSYDELRRINPRVVLCSLSAYGHDGPWANIPGIGGTIEPTAGLSALLGYEDGAPLNSGQMFPDAVAGMYGAASIVAALLERERSGEGQFIDISMQEANLGLAGDAAVEYLRNGTQRPRMGNRHTTFAPHGMYRCAGDESWVALACETDDQWQSLCAALGHEGWAADPRFATNTARKANERALESLLLPAVALCQRGELLRRLKGTGVIAAPVHDAFDIATEPRHRARGVVAEVEHAEAGGFPVVTHPFFFSRSLAPTPKAAPLHGEHGLEVLDELLGMTEEQYQRLVAAGVSGMGPPD